MNRRNFLKLAGVSATILLLPKTKRQQKEEPVYDNLRFSPTDLLRATIDFCYIECDKPKSIFIDWMFFGHLRREIIGTNYLDSSSGFIGINFCGIPVSPWLCLPTDVKIVCEHRIRYFHVHPHCGFQLVAEVNNGYES